MTKIRKKRKAKRYKFADEDYTGPEPADDVIISDASDKRYHDAFFWYGYHYDIQQAKQWIVEYLELKHDPRIKAIRQLAANEIVPTYGWMCKLLLKGWQLPRKSQDFLNAFLDKAQTQYVVEVVQPRAERNHISVYDKMMNKVGEYIELIDIEIDKLVQNPDHKFNAYQFLTERNPPVPVVNAIKAKYIPMLEEIKNEDGYSDMTVATYKKWFTFVEQLIDDLDRFAGNKKNTIVRKPRKTKVKSVDKVVEKFKYLPQYPELKIVSINPSTIVGASVLYTYNAKYNQLTMYVAANENGLGVKGTSILNYDETKSITKRIRKPAPVIELVLKSGKVSLRRLFDEIKTTNIPAKSRTSSDTVLLRVLK